MKSPGASPVKAPDPVAHAKALGAILDGEVHEFYSPFAMVPGVAEGVRIISPGYGEMEMVALVYDRAPLHVYTNSAIGERFLRRRFPAVRRHRVEAGDLHLAETDGGEAMTIELHSGAGPMRDLALVVRKHPDSAYVTERYEANRVWGSPFTCHGIDMRVAARARGFVRRAGAAPRTVDVDATLFRGSYGRIAPVRSRSVRAHGTR